MQAPDITNGDFALKFPEGFLWGVATSAFQVEGNPAEITDRTSDWAIWMGRDGKIADATTAASACEFYSRYEADIELCQTLNMKAFRLGLNWPALCLQTETDCELDPEGVAYYRKVLQSIKDRGMVTFVTLFHFCLPMTLAANGGWNNQRTVDAFERFAELSAVAFGDLVDHWLTINEPLVYAYQGYVPGNWPPGYRRNYLWSFQAIRKMLEGHARAYHAIHRVVKGASVSYPIHWRPFVARNLFSPLDQVSRYYRDQIFNHLFPTAIETGELTFPFPMSLDPPIRELMGPIEGLKGTVDFLALNYYTREICEFEYKWPPDIFGVQSRIARLETTDMGWEVYPEGLYYMLTEDIAPYRLDAEGKTRPIFITENGFAACFPGHLEDGDWSLDDDKRISFLDAHLKAVHQAIGDGANVKGYLHWSLLDNFEWSEGLSPRFGLVRVTYPTQERHLRKSAHFYAQIALNNGINGAPPGA